MGGFHFGNRYVGDAMPIIYMACVFLLYNPDISREEIYGENPDNSYSISIGGTELLFSLLFFWGLMVNFYGVLQYYTSSNA